MIRIIALVGPVLNLKSIQGFGVTSVDDTTTTTTTPTPTTTTTTTTTTTDPPDGSAPGVDQCFIGGGDCASCCGACTITTELDNIGKGSCVCYQASTTPDTSYNNQFLGTYQNDCVFIAADNVRFIQVRNQCLEEARRKCSLRRGEEVDARDASRARGRDSELISPTS